MDRRRIPICLKRWADRTWPLQPCLCDVWHDHVLFDGDRVTGLVDYGAVKIDHPAVDVARLLGSLVEDDADGWAIGLTAYREVRPFTADEAQLARALDCRGRWRGRRCGCAGYTTKGGSSRTGRRRDGGWKAS